MDGISVEQNDAGETVAVTCVPCGKLIPFVKSDDAVLLVECVCDRSDCPRAVA